MVIYGDLMVIYGDLIVIYGDLMVIYAPNPNLAEASGLRISVEKSLHNRL